MSRIFSLQQLIDVDYIQWDTTPTLPPTTPAEGLMYWDVDDGTLNLGMPGGGVNLQIGQEMLARVTNDTGSQIDNGTPVYVSGATGTNMTVAPADADFDLGLGFRTFAVATEDIPAGQKGYVTTQGFVRDIDTSAAPAAGTPFYLAVGGGFATAPPSAPDITVFMAFVTRKSATVGEIYVNIISIPNMNSLSDVDNTSLATGDVLMWGTDSDVWSKVSTFSPSTNFTSIIKTGLKTQGLDNDASTFPEGFHKAINDNVRLSMIGSASGTSLLTFGVDSDPYRRLNIKADGSLEWGPGDGVLDTSLYRDDEDILKTDDRFRVAIGGTALLPGIAIAEDNTGLNATTDSGGSISLSLKGTNRLNYSASQQLWEMIFPDGVVSLGPGSYTDSTGAISFGNENISTLGWIGIGTTPNNQLHILTASTDSTPLRIQASDNNDPIFQLKETGSGAGLLELIDANGNVDVRLATTTTSWFNGGNVGINVTDPDARLEILDTAAQLKLSYDATNYSQFTTDASGNLEVTASGGAISFGNENLSTTGNVGIGKAPSYPLDILTNGSSEAIRVNNIAETHWGRFRYSANTLLLEAEGANADMHIDAARHLNLFAGGANRMAVRSDGSFRVYGGSGTTIDYANLAVGSDGDLTITTVDSDGAAGDINLRPDGVTTIGDGTNQTVIEGDGTVRFDGTATVWNDIQFQISSGKIGQANAPSWSAFTSNTFEYQFAVNDFIDLGSNELVHSWKEGTAGNFHLHIALDAANATGSDRFAQFTTHIAYVDSSGVWTETPLTAELTIPDGSVTLKAFYLDMGDVSFSGLTIGTQVKVRIERIAATGGTEYADEIFINQVGCHLEEDTAGSRQEGTK